MNVRRYWRKKIIGFKHFHCSESSLDNMLLRRTPIVKIILKFTQHYWCYIWKKSVYCNLNDIRSLWLLQRRKAAMKTPSQDAINLQIFVSLTWARGQFACEQFGSNAFMNFLTLHWYCRSKTDSLFLVYEFLSPFNFWKHEPSESLVNTKPTLELEFFFLCWE